jgi:TPR repeat protein
MAARDVVRLFTCTSFDEPPSAMYAYPSDAVSAQIIATALDYLGREYSSSYIACVCATPGSDPYILKGIDSLKSSQAANGMILYIISEDDDGDDQPVFQPPRTITIHRRAPVGSRLPNLGVNPSIAPARPPVSAIRKGPGILGQSLASRNQHALLPVASGIPALNPVRDQRQPQRRIEDVQPLAPLPIPTPAQPADAGRKTGFEMLLLQYSDFDFSKRTANGAGVGVEMTTGLTYWVKPIKLPSDSSPAQFVQEVAKLCQHQHGSILHLEGYCESPLALVYDNAEHGSLHDMLDDESIGNAPPAWGSTAKQIVLFGVAEGMAWLHGHRIMHRNLHPANILLDDNLYPLIGDGGVTRNYSRWPALMAPEILAGEKYKSKIDVWSYGMIVYQIVAGVPLFDPGTPFQTLKESILAGRIPEISSALPPGFDDLIRRCLSREPGLRPTFEVILNSFLAGNLLLPNVDMAAYRAYQNLIHPTKPEESRVEQLRETAECADIAAQLEIARCYLRGYGVALNLKEANRYLVMAANLGNSEAQFRHSLLQYRYKRDEAKIIRFLRLAADQGNVHAQLLLSRVMPGQGGRDHYLEMATQSGNTIACLLTGINLQKTDAISAVKFLKLAADGGSRTAQLLYAVAVHSGNGGVPVDLTQANEYYRMAAEQGDLKAACNLAFDLQRGDGCAENIDEANRWYRMSAEGGYPNAQANYAYNLMNGIGVDRNPTEAMRFYRLAAEEGHLTAMFNYGTNLVKGDCGEQNIAKGLEMLRTAADKGHQFAQFQLATFLMGHPGVTTNLAEAAKYFKMAADQGNVRAQYNYATAYQKGRGIPVNLPEANRYLKMAADGGYALAQVGYGANLEIGLGCPKNLTEANNYYRLAADQGNAHAEVNLALHLSKGIGVKQSFEESNRYLRLAMEQNHPKAFYQLALHCQKGSGVPLDIRLANEMFKKSADLGYALAQFYYGYNLFNGIGCEKNPTEANRYYKLAADAGNANAQCNLSCSYFNGFGCEKNMSEAYRYCRMSADGGNAVAQYNYGVHLSNGLGIAQDLEEANKYFKKAAEQGNLNAMFRLGQNLLEGTGIQQNVELGKKWLRMAAQAGHQAAKQLLETIEAR